MGFNPYLKNLSSKAKTAPFFSKTEKLALVTANAENTVDLESKNESWGSVELLDHGDTYDKNVSDRKVKQIGSGFLTTLRKAIFFYQGGFRFATRCASNRHISFKNSR